MEIHECRICRANKQLLVCAHVVLQLLNLVFLHIAVDNLGQRTVAMSMQHALRLVEVLDVDLRVFVSLVLVVNHLVGLHLVVCLQLLDHRLLDQMVVEVLLELVPDVLRECGLRNERGLSLWSGYVRAILSSLLDVLIYRLQILDRFGVHLLHSIREMLGAVAAVIGLLASHSEYRLYQFEVFDHRRVKDLLSPWIMQENVGHVVALHGDLLAHYGWLCIRWLPWRPAIHLQHLDVIGGTELLQKPQE